MADYGCLSPLFGSVRLGHTSGKLTGGIESIMKGGIDFLIFAVVECVRMFYNCRGTGIIAGGIFLDDCWGLKKIKFKNSPS